jgi:hypothetical protein
MDLKGELEVVEEDMAVEAEVDEVSAFFVTSKEDLPRGDSGICITSSTCGLAGPLLTLDDRRGGRGGGGRGGYGGGDRDRPPPPESGSNRMRKMIIKFAEEDVSAARCGGQDGGVQRKF